MKNLISVEQLNEEKISLIFKFASFFENEIKTKESLEILKGNVMASLFYEPSTRTRFSFESAMLKLGGQVISESSVVFSSISKGESLEDTIKTLERYVDVIAIRHPEIGSAQKAASVAKIPVLNAGDGAGEHPTQALLDLYTIIKEKGDPKNLRIALVGDLKNGRTIHSLMKLLKLYTPKITLVSPQELKLPDKYKEGVGFEETNNLSQALGCDVIYMTRIQKERFSNKNEYEKLKNVFLLKKDDLKCVKKDAIIMHPLPRVNEIEKEIDDDPRAKYFDQVENGLYVRMALLALLLNKIDIRDKIAL